MEQNHYDCFMYMPKLYDAHTALPNRMTYVPSSKINMVVIKSEFQSNAWTLWLTSNVCTCIVKGTLPQTFHILDIKVSGVNKWRTSIQRSVVMQNLQNCHSCLSNLPKFRDPNTPHSNDGRQEGSQKVCTRAGPPWGV